MSPPIVKLSFGEILSESCSFFFSRLPLFFHLVTIPWILSLVLRIAGNLLLSDTPFSMLIEKAADAIPSVMFMVGWMRLTLLGPTSVSHLPGRTWSPRETAFFIHLLKIAGITYLLLAGFTLTAGSIDPSVLSQSSTDPELARREAMAAPLGLGFIISSLLALRVSFGLAATAVDLPFSPRESWALSRGNAWTIMGVLFVIFFANAIATLVAALVPLSLIRGTFGGGMAGAVVAWTTGTLVSYAGAALAATAQAIIFRRLTGWRPAS